MKVYIIRHGETEYNKRGILQGNINSSLLEKSKEEAKELNKWIKKIDFDLVISSHLKRAFDTAKIITNDKYMIQKSEDISEMTFGKWQGKTKDEILKNEAYKEQYNNYFFNPCEYKNINGGESFDDIIKRANKFLNYIFELENKGLNNVLVVTHGAFIKAILMIVKNNSLDKFWEEPYVHNLSLTLLDVKAKQIKLLLESSFDY